jgi:hypothetical protein
MYPTSVTLSSEKFSYLDFLVDISSRLRANSFSLNTALLTGDFISREDAETQRGKGAMTFNYPVRPERS